MNNRNRSIIMQVAVKEVTNLGWEFTPDSIKQAYDTIIAAHQLAGIDVDADAPRGGGRSGGKPSSGGTGGGGSKTPDAPTFLYNGEVWADYRGLKQSGAVKDTFPDFRPVGGGFGTGEYILDRDGTPKEAGTALAAAADNSLAVEVL